MQIYPVDAPGVKERQQTKADNQYGRSKLSSQSQIKETCTRSRDQGHIKPSFGDPVISVLEDLPLFGDHIRVQHCDPGLAKGFGKERHQYRETGREPTRN